MKATSDGISASDWSKVRDLAGEIVEASVAGDDQHLREGERRILHLLRTLEEKYGQRPSLLATRADYTHNRRSAARLLERGYALAADRGDRVNQRLIASSLTEIYVDSMNLEQGSRWFYELRRFPAADDGERRERRRFAAALRR